MNEEQILQKLQAVTAKYTKAEHLTLKTRLLDEMGLNSLAMFGLLLDIEDAFGVTFPMQKVGELRTVGDVVTALQELIREKAGADSPSSG